MSAILPFPYRLFILALLSAALIGFGYVKGLEHAAVDAAKTEIRAAKGTIKTMRAQQAVSASASAAHELVRIQTRTVYKTIDREVIRYVQASAPACRLPAGFVRLHDAAATASIPAAPGESDARPSAITDTDALGIIAGNYETCTETRQQLIDLQGWVRAQQALAKQADTR